MSKTLLVFGATGNQGSSVIKYVLNDPELSREFRIRAITRDTNSEKAAQLKELKVEVVQGDVTDKASLEAAMTDVHTVYIMTTPDFSPNAVEVEFNGGKSLADTAVAKGVQYIIFSTLPNVTEISAGKCVKVTPFDAKAKVEQYIRGLPVNSAFVSPGFFMENFNYPFYKPQKTLDGSWILPRDTPAESKVPFIDAGRDLGKYVGAILAQPDKYHGKTLCLAVKQYTWQEIADLISKITGQKVTFMLISSDEFKAMVPFAQDLFDEGFLYVDEFGYWGRDSEKETAWARENVRGKLTTLEEYWNMNPIQLE